MGNRLRRRLLSNPSAPIAFGESSIGLPTGEETACISSITQPLACPDKLPSSSIGLPIRRLLGYQKLPGVSLESRYRRASCWKMPCQSVETLPYCMVGASGMASSIAQPIGSYPQFQRRNRLSHNPRSSNGLLLTRLSGNSKFVYRATEMGRKPNKFVGFSPLNTRAVNLFFFYIVYAPPLGASPRRLLRAYGAPPALRAPTRHPQSVFDRPEFAPKGATLGPHGPQTSRHAQSKPPYATSRACQLRPG